MMLSALLSNPKVVYKGNPSVEIFGISLDSRNVKKGDLFVALAGANTDGKKFIEQAIQKGASAVLTEQEVNATVPVAILKNIRSELGKISSLVYGDPAKKLTLVGVTGTNGKTTTAVLLEQLFEKLGKKSGYIGTLCYRWNGKEVEAPRTTPEATDLYQMLSSMVAENVTHVALECSSHGIELGRLNSIPLDVAVFTNLTRDHLDFHPSMEAYEGAKKKLFSEILFSSSKENPTAILNFDDSVGRKWAQEFSKSVLTYSLHQKNADLFADEIEFSATGISAVVQIQGVQYSLQSPLVGQHNLSNLLAALGVAVALKLPISEVIKVLKTIKGVPGRLERVENSKGIHVWVDYAHSEDALENVLTALSPLPKKKLFVVFGCGGDRDRGKRPRMAQVVSKFADAIIITSDNPRTEKPETILEEILMGITEKMKNEKVYSFVDRRKAIGFAINKAQKDDFVLIAGKGHETTQEIQGKKFPFDDRLVAKEFLEMRGNV